MSNHTVNTKSTIQGSDKGGEDNFVTTFVVNKSSIYISYILGLHLGGLLDTGLSPSVVDN